MGACMDVIKTLCKIADSYPKGISESNPLLDDLALYSLKQKNLIRPAKFTQSGMIYELTASGWDLSVSSHKLYDN